MLVDLNALASTLCANFFWGPTFKLFNVINGGAKLDLMIEYLGGKQNRYSLKWSLLNGAKSIPQGL